ncbi:MAG TPA: hypothetical protein VGA18_04570 [Rhodothermales bacterium]
MPAVLTRLQRELFGGGGETAIDIFVFKTLETFIVYRAIDYCWRWGVFIQDIGEVVLPLGVASYVDVGFMFENGVSTANAAVATIFMMAGFLRLHRYAYLVSMALFHLQFAARFCLGEIPHSSNFVGMGILALGLGAVLFDDAATRRRFVTGTLVFFIGLAYFTGAVSKLIATGPSWPDGRHLWIWIAEKAADKYAEFGVLELNPVQQLVVNSWLLATVSLAFGLIVEIAAPAFWFERARPFAAVGILALHAGIYLTMRIVFSASMVIVAIVGFPWGRWIRTMCPNLEAYLTGRTGALLTRFG